MCVSIMNKKTTVFGGINSILLRYVSITKTLDYKKKTLKHYKDYSNMVKKFGVSVE